MLFEGYIICGVKSIAPLNQPAFCGFAPLREIFLFNYFLLRSTLTVTERSRSVGNLREQPHTPLIIENGELKIENECSVALADL